MLDVLIRWFAPTSAWELPAAILSLAYTLLAVRRSLWAWPCAFVGSAIYVWVMLEARLYHQVVLSVFYVIMAVYGYWEWRRSSETQGEVAIERWPLRTHIAVVVSVVILSVASGWLLSIHTDGKLPYADAFVAWGSVAATWMVARRVIENWLYWIVVDGVAAAAYFHQGLNPTGWLFLAYVGIVIRGYAVWLRESRASGKLAAGT